MITITNKTAYGIAALVELAQHHGRGLVQIKDITSRRNIPQGYLGQILNRLIKAGLVKAFRGQKGGYTLAREPERISLLNILEVLEGPVVLIGRSAHHSAIAPMILVAEESVKKAFDISLDSVVARLAESTAEGTYVI